MVKHGDEQAVAVFNEYNKIVMPDHQDLTNIQIENIDSYINEETEHLTIVKTSDYYPDYAKPYHGKKSIIDRGQSSVS